MLYQSTFQQYTGKPVYNGHSREPEMCTLGAVAHYMHY